MPFLMTFSSELKRQSLFEGELNLRGTINVEADYMTMIL